MLKDFRKKIKNNEQDSKKFINKKIKIQRKNKFKKLSTFFEKVLR